MCSSNLLTLSARGARHVQRPSIPAITALLCTHPAGVQGGERLARAKKRIAIACRFQSETMVAVWRQAVDCNGRRWRSRRRSRPSLLERKIAEVNGAGSGSGTLFLGDKSVFFSFTPPTQHTHTQTHTRTHTLWLSSFLGFSTFPPPSLSAAPSA